MKRALTVTAIVGLLGLGVLPAAVSAAPPLLWQVPEVPSSGSAAGEISNPKGIAVDPSNGHVYVAENANARISEFTAWGEFVKAFGWNVNASSPTEELQVCTAESGCQAGTKGGGSGQLNSATGLAVGHDGNLYAAEVETHRVQAFAPDGSFLFMFGAEVNRTKVEALAPEAEQNRCPVDPGDVCQAGVIGTGPGEFSNVGLGGFPGDTVAIGPGGAVYVGDVGRIEKFNPAGEFTGEIEGAALADSPVIALDVDGAGNSYVVRAKDEPPFGVTHKLLKLGPAGEVLSPTFELPRIEPFRPPQSEGAALESVALGASGNLYVALKRSGGGNNVGTAPRIIEFDAAGNLVIPSEEEVEAEEELAQEPIPPEPFLFGQVFGLPNFYIIPGLATSSACGIEGEDIFASYFSTPKSLLRAYGPLPDPSICPPPPVPPAIIDTYATAVDSDGATVGARINSNFWGDATYYVQYGTGKCSEGGCVSEQPTAPGSELGSESAIAVPTAGVFLPSLQPGTTYHYRFVAQSGGGGPVFGEEATFTTPPPPLPTKTECPNQAFRIGSAAFLADCRAYEMVSPLDKDGADIFAVNEPVTEVPARLNQSATSGDRLTFSASRAFGDAPASPYSSQYLASRDPVSGWSTHSISPPRDKGLMSIVETGETEYWAFSEDLCQGWLRLPFEAEPDLDPAEVDGYANLFKRQDCGAGAGAYEALSTVVPPNGPIQQKYLPVIQGASADGRCTVFRAQDALTPEAPVLGEQKTILYESCDGVLRLVAILPDGTPSPTSSTAGIGNVQEAHPQSKLRGDGSYRAVSEDGTRIYWTTPGTGPGQLYLRINADQPQSFVSAGGKCIEPEMACTLPVSGKVSSDPARFWSASPDGSKALFTIGENLYEYDATDLGATQATLIAEGVLGLLGASEDAGRIYFASTKALAPGAVAGQRNLYYRELGSAPRFIGALASVEPGRESQAISTEPGFRNSRVTPDGLHAAFMSAAPLTGYDNTDQRNGEADREVFLYDATASGGEGKLVCVSCDPSGARPIGANITPTDLPLWAAARIPTWPSSLYASRPLSGDGSRLFFDSFGPLVQRDTNGKADVYEWQGASSQEDCEETGAERYVESSSGCLSLISSGQSDQGSEFIDADPDGDNVFFATGESLLPQDPGLIDVYLARRGGGFPPPPAPPAACEGEACQSPPAPPDDPTPASVAYRGAGNVAEPKAKPRCAKGKTRHKGRCVPRKRNARAQKSSKRTATHDRRDHR